MSRINQWTTNGLLVVGLLFMLMGVLVGASAAMAGVPGVATFHNPLGQTAAPVIDLSSFTACN